MSYICAECVEEPCLKRLVQENARPKHLCSYCGSTTAVDLWVIALRCEEIIDVFFDESSDTMAVRIYDRTPAGNDLQTTVEELTRLPWETAEIIAGYIHKIWYDADGETRYPDGDPYFVRKSSMAGSLGHAWQNMHESLRADARFFNPKAAVLLDSIFGQLISDRDRSGNPVVIEAGPGTSIESLYRGRVFQTEDPLIEALCWPERYLGSPAVGVGAAGRMNGQGQPAFYGATHQEICIAEVRPPVGSKVALASFRIRRPLRLLDLSRLASVEISRDGSLFDPATLSAFERRDFIRTLGQRLSAPVVPELQDRDYLVTQAVADYLAAEERLNLDGIVYPSAQGERRGERAAGCNVVLFRKACGVTDAEASEPTALAELWMYEDDGPGRFLNPSIEFKDQRERWHSRPGIEPALELVRDSIVIYDITGVRYDADPNPVEHVVPRSKPFFN